MEQIEETTVYDSINYTPTATSEALNLMRQTDANNARFGNGSDDIDLHHALLGKNLGGGLAHVGTVCNSVYGFGVSTGIIGNMVNTNLGQTYWDIYVFAHELG